jgi:hypothetical protein
MSPRPAPSRHDATAQQFLKAAVQLIDAYLDDQPLHARPARLRSIRRRQTQASGTNHSGGDQRGRHPAPR